MLVKRLSGFVDRSNVLPPTQFRFRGGLGTCDALLHLTHESIGVGGLLLNILKQFLLNRQYRVSVDGFYSGLTTVRSGVPQGIVLGPLLSL